jgi:hypothetical protein
MNTVSVQRNKRATALTADSKSNSSKSIIINGVAKINNANVE